MSAPKKGSFRSSDAPRTQSAIGSGGGLIQQNYNSSAQRYSSSFELGIRMIQVAIGVTVGLFMSQILVYATGRRKSVAHFAF